MNPFEINPRNSQQLNEIKLTLKPLDKPPSTYPIGAADIEGVGGPNGFLVGAIQTEKSYEVYTTPRDMINAFKKRSLVKYRFFFHNLSYDYGVLQPWFEENDYATLINGRVYKVSLHRQKANTRFLADSLLFSGGLALKTLGQAIGLNKFDTPDNVLNFNPNCRPAERTKLENDPTVLAYLERDVNVAHEYMTLFQNTINELGGQMKFTLASTAMDLYRRQFMTEEYQTPFQARNDYARHAYYGGRVEPFVLGLSKNVNVYDINSLYPYVMQKYELPHPNYLIGPIDNPPKSLIFTYEGVSRVRIHIPPLHCPPLPHHIKGKLYFPTGTWDGYYTHADLRKAVDMGAKILYVYSTLYSTRTVKPFDDYVHTLYKRRQELKAAGDPRQHVYKIMLNSLYGKFGQRQDAGLREIKDILRWFDLGQPDYGDFIEIGDSAFWVIEKHIPQQAPYVNTLWAAYITSHARLELYEYMLQAGHDLIYCDTDSVFVHGELPVSNQLGAMKLEHLKVNVEVYGPKAYFLTFDDTVTSLKCKGVPTANRLQFLLEGQTTFEHPTGVLEAGIHNRVHKDDIYYPSQWRKITKRQHLDQPKRRLLVPDFDYLHQSPTAAFEVSQLAD